MSAAPANTKALRIFIDNSARIYLDGNPVKSPDVTESST